MLQSLDGMRNNPDVVDDLFRLGLKFVVISFVLGAITSKIKHAIKLKTSPARLAQMLQPSLVFCFSLQPMTVHRPVRRRHWLQAKAKC